MSNNTPASVTIVFVCYSQADEALMESVRTILQFWAKENRTLQLVYESLPAEAAQLQQHNLHDQADIIVVGLSVDLVSTLWFEQTVDDYVLWQKNKQKQVVFLNLRSVFLSEEYNAQKIAYLPSRKKSITELSPLLLGLQVYAGLQKIVTKHENLRGFAFPTKKRPPAPPEGKYYLVAIGIDEYPSAPQLSSLANAVKDAKAVVQLLQKRYGFLPQNTYTLYNEQASRDRIFETLRQLATQVTPQDRLFIYHAGHGVYHNFFKMGYWIPADSNFQPRQAIWYPHLEIANQDIARCIQQINSLHTFLVSDSCFSGTMFENTRSANSNFTQKLENIPSRWGLSSGRAEPVSDGNAGEHSPFAQALIGFLQQSTEPTLLVSDLIQHIKKTVGRSFEQQPIGNRLQNLDEKGMGEFVLHQEK